MEQNFISKAEDAMKEAEKKLKGGFLSKLMSSKTERIDAASELYREAAKNYKLAKKWDLAAQAFLKAADIEQMKKEESDAGDCYEEAANMFRKTNTSDAARTFQKAVEQYYSSGKISQAARLKKTIGEIYETDHQYSLAAAAFDEAVEFYQMDGEYSSKVNQLCLKSCELKLLADEVGNYSEIIKTYETVAEKYLENKLTAPSARDPFFRCCLLHLANDDTVGAENAIVKYSDLDPSFANTREAKFVKGLITAIEAKSVENFSTECYEFNKIISLDKWKTIVLNKIKNLLEKSFAADFSVV